LKEKKLVCQVEAGIDWRKKLMAAVSENHHHLDGLSGKQSIAAAIITSCATGPVELQNESSLQRRQEY
jgi:hypothetical protein